MGLVERFMVFVKLAKCICINGNILCLYIARLLLHDEIAFKLATLQGALENPTLRIHKLQRNYITEPLNGADGADGALRGLQPP